MKKKKNPSSERFKNDPLRSLKGIRLRTVSGADRTPPAQNSGTSDEDDASLFLRAVEGAKKFDRAKERGTPVDRGGREDSRLFLDAMEQIGTKQPCRDRDEEDDEAPRRSSSGRMKQLKRGMIVISEEIDLHGSLRDEALAKLRRFISGAYGRGRKAVLVITGKGINSPDGPVLRGAVAEWLRTDGRNLVAEFAPAPRDKGGSGAFVVFLRSR